MVTSDDGTVRSSEVSDQFECAGEGIDFQWRSTADGSTTFVRVTGVAAPQWVELVRTGNAVSAYYSSNGTAWTQIGTAKTITLSSADLAGVAVWAINSAGLYTAAFNGMAVSNADSRRVPAVALLPPLERETVTCAVANAAWSE